MNMPPQSRSGEAMARRFHEAYERLSQQYGYTTRVETRQFDPDSPNGRLMIAVCEELFAASEKRDTVTVPRSLAERSEAKAPSSALPQEPDVDAFLQHAEALGLMSDQALADEVKRGGSVVVEKYIAGLKWSEHASEDEKALVAGNLRTFWTWLHINSRGRIKSALSATSATNSDTERLNWLERMVVEVRAPLRWGSRQLFIANPEEVEGADDDPSAIRAQIDYQRNGAKTEGRDA